MKPNIDLDIGRKTFASGLLPELIAVLRRSQPGDLVAVVGGEESVGPELDLRRLRRSQGDQLNEYVHWHVEEGRKLRGPYLSRVEIKRSALYQPVHEFMERYEFFALPVNQVMPFDLTQHYPTEINGVKRENYLAWMKSACYITATGNPATSVPCAYSKSGLPVGIQIVGRNHGDWRVLQMAFAFEQARNLKKRKLVALG